MNVSRGFSRENFVQRAGKKKLTFDKFVQLFKYSAFRHVKTLINNATYCGYVYRLFDAKLEDIQAVQEEFSNVVFYRGFLEYAPEIKTVWVFIANKRIKGVEKC